ncbi:Toluene efflux pump periplasmic linker protein TtgD precursor [Pseudovibrio axinellae]|uniref:Toluene efflux pump periplasmic linker protein TtgD n=1 Tax=Pseudovibrio axinellae TaxID=989403 RepID=A0A165XL31_9HYPH|nr:efflux RND transporter periplasmic adaptor subunit [Pseudovibrio axinellae]KZL17807.1 Toluene efflux pump periplasmic linker protein TtgD precursor [Pseudovibrio axinellae]SEP71697.1 membrane fusion protein, multidrug efflux system [Pseudovibrio axinellae]
MAIRFSHVLALGLTAGIGIWMATGTTVVMGQATDENSTPPPAERMKAKLSLPFAVKVETINATLRTPFLEMRGRTQADTRVEVHSETSGIVNKRPVSEGMFVHKGDLLCSLDRGAREARVLQANAALAQANIDYKAANELNNKGFSAANRVVALKASRDSASALLQEAELELERTDIRAPIDGIIESPLTEMGAMLGVGKVCATIMAPDPMLAIGAVSESNIQAVKIGQAANVSLVTGQSVQGKVSYIASSADPDTRTFRVEVELPNPDFSLKDGVTTRTLLQLAEEKAHFVSPGILTLADNGNIGLRGVDEDNKVVFYPVELIGGDTQGVWLKGLPDEVTVITVGQDFVKDGRTVNPVSEAAGGLQ